ncbi:DUF4238 domain-containing protein [Bradyrhizobium sp. Ash2021]|uniref:DUF4238 domain-containing protein n=1 Tax=Bradyrhizobium sp. Ash2021 TaxID=2954771 RepID=UPI002815D56C|nr:DUF4238 domain-containing protein [Bradyrhizobium sp. Ash2021]WMT72004.1 DUF4238 domain-containing protein [Bradyrhizobium sp. Ash2021]
MMSKTRNNHYVPQWYQEGFFEVGQNTLAYLNMKPPQRVLSDGRVITERALFEAPTSRAFCQLDLYSTFFGTSINDEIERHLFGNIDAKGANAIRAYAGSDVGEWHRHFQTLFEYIDIQKTRTPKGVDWLKAQYPTLTQNDLMAEMQGIRMLHCKIWAEGVREIVSAEDADVKFITSDHPVTIYNHAAGPDSQDCAYPNDPAIALKASQTIFPLDRNFCLILTNLEYARDPATKPLDKRTFARNYRQSMVRTDAFIRTRKLSSQEVNRVNYVIKRRARRFIAGGRKEWLSPEKYVVEPWNEFRTTLLPPNDGLWHFGGEMYAKFEDGRVHYQDEFGRTEKERDFLKKRLPTEPLKPGDLCGCGYGRTFEACCMLKPVPLRPAWSERSIRERNMMLQNGIVNVLGLDGDKDWTQVRRDLTDEQISKIYRLYEGLWPLETDLLALLPKPDGMARAIYTGSIHPTTITDFALGASLYFGEVIIEHPFVHAGTLADKFNPVKNPRAYRGEFLKAVVFFFTVMPLVELGLVNLIPDPCSFDAHLRDQMLHMAKSRTAGTRIDHRNEPRIERLMKEDTQRNILSFPREVLRSQISRAMPNIDTARQEETLNYIEQLKESDPLAVLQKDSLAGGEGGQLSMMKLAPNFEITMYLAQATGASIVTDSPFRWNEIRGAIRQRVGGPSLGLADLARSIERSDFAFPQSVADIASFALDQTVAPNQALMRDIFKYLSNLASRAQKPNWEAQLAGRFARAHAPIQAAIRKARISAKAVRVSGVFPLAGIQDNAINRLLLMSSSESHLPSVPVAFFLRESSDART